MLPAAGVAVPEVAAVPVVVAVVEFVVEFVVVFVVLVVVVASSVLQI